eukprot:484610-Rhodomonas_salina.4
MNVKTDIHVDKADIYDDNAHVSGTNADIYGTKTDINGGRACAATPTKRGCGQRSRSSCMTRSARCKLRSSVMQNKATRGWYAPRPAVRRSIEFLSMAVPGTDVGTCCYQTGETAEGSGESAVQSQQTLSYASRAKCADTASTLVFPVH